MTKPRARHNGARSGRRVKNATAHLTTRRVSNLTAAHNAEQHCEPRHRSREGENGEDEGEEGKECKEEEDGAASVRDNSPSGQSRERSCRA